MNVNYMESTCWLTRFSCFQRRPLHVLYGPVICTVWIMCSLFTFRGGANRPIAVTYKVM